MTSRSCVCAVLSTSPKNTKIPYGGGEQQQNWAELYDTVYSIYLFCIQYVYTPFLSYPKNTKISCEMGKKGGVCYLQAARIPSSLKNSAFYILVTWPLFAYFYPWAAGQNTFFTIPSPGQLSNLPVTLPKILLGGNYAVLQWRQCLNSPNASLGCCWSFKQIPQLLHRQVKGVNYWQSARIPHPAFECLVAWPLSKKGFDSQIICKIILIASHIEILPSTVKLVNDYDTSKY